MENTNLNNEQVKNPLREPLNHSLEDLLKEIQFGRPDETHLDIKDNKIQLLEEDLECVNMYLDDLKIQRKSEDGQEYSIVGRIKQFEKKYLKQLSEVENYYLQQFKNK